VSVAYAYMSPSYYTMRQPRTLPPFLVQFFIALPYVVLLLQQHVHRVLFAAAAGQENQPTHVRELADGRDDEKRNR
jgi:hypothetical protein